jgi:hypothetical protein
MRRPSADAVPSPLATRLGRRATRKMPIAPLAATSSTAGRSVSSFLVLRSRAVTTQPTS